MRKMDVERMGRSILTGAIHGLWTWLVYGVVEFVLACVIPLLFQSDVELLPWQWHPIALVFALYLLVGLIFGCTSGAILDWSRRPEDSASGTLHQITASLMLILAFAANLIRAWPLHPSEYVALAIAAILVAFFGGALASSFWLERMAFLANPCAVSLLLLIIPWVNRAALVRYSTILKMGASVLLFGAVVVGSAVWPHLRLAKVRMERRQVAVAGTAALLLLSGMVVSRTIFTVHAHQNNEPYKSGKCNILLITMDTVRADHLSVYGYDQDTTPYLREFARDATVYNRAIATSDWTLTTHASMFTGLYPRWHGAYFAPPRYRWGRPLGSEHITLAEVLRSHGYSTAAEVANYGFLSQSLGLARGFAVYHAPRPIRLFQMPWQPRPFYLREGARRVLSLAADRAVFDGNLLRAADINRHAFELINRARSNEQPFFIFLNYMDAHGPYVLPSPFDTKFAGRDPHFKRVSDHIRLTLAVNSGKHHIDAAEKRHLLSQYDGGIAYEDEQIGSLLADLRKLELYDNTLIIITGDHGELFGKHDLMGHNVGSVDQELVHVPLLIKYPGQHEGHRSDELVSQVDLMPTVLDVAGCPQPAGLQGRSLRLARSDSDAVYSEAIAVTYLTELNPRFRGVHRAIFTGTAKLITWTEGRPELYDLASDPDETRNQFRSDDRRAVELAERLQAWAAAAPQQIEQPRKLDNNSVERLKSLGYVQ